MTITIDRARLFTILGMIAVLALIAVPLAVDGWQQHQRQQQLTDSIIDVRMCTEHGDCG